MARAHRAGFQDLATSASRVSAKFEKITVDLSSSRTFDESLFWSALQELMGVEQELDVRER